MGSHYGSFSLDDIAPPLKPRARTPSLSKLSLSSSSSNDPSSSSSFSSTFPPLPPLDTRLGALSVPPPSRPIIGGHVSGSQASPNKGTACLPCKRGHLKCGKGRRPCEPCIKKGRPEDCFEGADPVVAQTMLQLYYQRKQDDAAKASSSKSISKPVFDADSILFPISQDPSFSLGQAADQLAYPPVGSFDIPTSMPGTRPVLLVMGKDMRIGRASNESLRTFGYHSHEMIQQSLEFYLPRDEKTRWTKFSSQLFAYPLSNKGSLPMNAVELARVPMQELTAKVAKMITISEDFHIRDHRREYIPVTIELWYSSYFGASVEDVRTYDTAPVIAKISPHVSKAQPTPLVPPTLSSAPHAFTTSTSAFPSVLLPASANIVPSLPPLQLPPRRASPLKASADRLPPMNLPPMNLPPLGASLAPLPGIGQGLPSLTLPPRKRRVSATLGDLPPLSGDLFDHGSGLGSYTRPRLRSPSPVPGHRRSLSSETGQSTFSGFSGSSTDYGLPSLPPLGSSTSSSGLPPLMQPRPPSRNRRPSGNFQMADNLQQMETSQQPMGVNRTLGSVIYSDRTYSNPSPSKFYSNLSPSKVYTPLPHLEIPNYKGRRSYINIDGDD